MHMAIAMAVFFLSFFLFLVSWVKASSGNKLFRLGRVLCYFCLLVLFVVIVQVEARGVEHGK